jgi:hypothetical protein
MLTAPRPLPNPPHTTATAPRPWPSLPVETQAQIAQLLANLLQRRMPSRHVATGTSRADRREH